MAGNAKLGRSSLWKTTLSVSAAIFTTWSCDQLSGSCDFIAICTDSCVKLKTVRRKYQFRLGFIWFRLVSLVSSGLTDVSHRMPIDFKSQFFLIIKLNSFNCLIKFVQYISPLNKYRKHSFKLKFMSFA